MDADGSSSHGRRTFGLAMAQNFATNANESELILGVCGLPCHF
jgi:hypothetical protein